MNIDCLNNINKINKILNEYIEKEEYNIEITIEGKPINYVRERSGRGKHFYNPKGDKSEEFKNKALHKLSKEEYNLTRELVENSSNYYVYITADFYVPTQQSSSQKDIILKEYKKILPNKTPDDDNYVKFLLDALHNVFYDDDAKVVGINANKYYSVNPRTEIKVKILK